MATAVNEESIDDDLYHYDFTTASSWEVFIARIEEIIYMWKLTSLKQKKQLKAGEFKHLEWKILSENVNFADTKFVLSWHSGEGCGTQGHNQIDDFHEDVAGRQLDCLEEMMKLEHDFIPIVSSENDETIPHVLTRWYGLRDFLVLTPFQGGIISESKLKTLISSFAIAIDNTKCDLPMFIRGLEPWQKFYLGISSVQGIRADFEMIHLKKIPPQCKHMTGLSNLFKSKITSLGQGLDQVTASVRFSYLLKNWTSYLWVQEVSTVDDPNQIISSVMKLPIGTLHEPISSMTLNAVWPEVLENIVIDNEGYTDFDPNLAPIWTLSITKADNIICSLSIHLQEFILFCNFTGTSEELLGELPSKSNVSEFREPLNTITESSIPKLSDLLFSDSSKKNYEGPLPKNLLLPMLHYLFPDLDNGHPYQLKEENNQSYKTCQEDSLVWRLSCLMIYVLHNLGGAKAAAHLWLEFSQELRFRWSSDLLIPGVTPGLPNSKTCLLHQKLQMLNCCIERKLELQKAQTHSQDSDESENEDEFFDCNSEEEGETEEGKQTPKHSLWNTPTGRLERHPTLKLLSNGQPLYIPRTQGIVPKTEDQEDEFEELLMMLGTDAKGSLLRAQLLSSTLLSEMECFKAANPGAMFEDFIRWYSARDWIEKEEIDECGEKIVTGELSERMLIPGNPWHEVWMDAKPVPARRQKRLFDETKEAERALHFVECATPSETGRLLLPVITHVVMSRLSSEIEKFKLPSLQTTLDRMVRKAENRSRQKIRDINIYQDMVIEVNMVESVIAQVKSLEQKFQVECSETSFIGDLISFPEVEIPGGPAGGQLSGRIKAIFAEAHRVDQMLDIDEVETGPDNKQEDQNKNPPLNIHSKEFILRARNGTFCHRLTAFITKNDITMAGAFSRDSVFFLNIFSFIFEYSNIYYDYLFT